MADITLRIRNSSLIPTAAAEPHVGALATTKSAPLTIEEMDDDLIHLQNSKENQLGKPSANGYILSSDVDGNRSWIEPLMSGTVDGSFLIWNTSTEKWTEETNTIYDATNNNFKWGSGNTSSTALTTAWGFNNTASETGSTVWGALNTSSGGYSTAFGSYNSATGISSTAWGAGNKSHNTNTTAWGALTEATGVGSTSYGFNTLSSGQYSTAFGIDTVSTSSGSTAFGEDTTSNGNYSTSWGSSVVNDGNYTTVIGLSSTSSPVTITKDNAFIVQRPTGGIGFNSDSPDNNTFDVQLGRVEKIIVGQTNPVSINLTTNDYMVSVNTSSNAQTVALLSTPTTGRTFYIVDESGNANTNNITVDGNGQNINGSATYTINTDYGFVKVVYNGTQYLVIGKD